MTQQRPIYLDHHATTPLDPRVREAMAPTLGDDFGNASSASHVYGWRAEAVVEAAREQLAVGIGAAEPRELIFTSGTTESDNLALQGVLRANRARRDHLITTEIEHPAVLDTARYLEGEGFRVTYLPVDGEGLVDPASVADAIDSRTALVSVMAANSEIGVLQPLAEIGEICRAHDVLFHTDAAQAVGKVPLDVEALGIDLLSMCAHKLYGPKGVGALYVRTRRPRIRIEPLLYGGGHERGLRSGTLPVPLIVGFGCAVGLCAEELEQEAVRLTKLRDHLFESLRASLDGVWRNGHAERRLPGNLNVSFDGVDADHLLVALPGLALSTGSACTSASAEPSHVLSALGLSGARVRGALRFGLGRSTTERDVDAAAGQVVHAVGEARRKRSESLPRRGSGQ
jgi:cysteine desulfurase